MSKEVDLAIDECVEDYIKYYTKVSKITTGTLSGGGFSFEESHVEKVKRIVEKCQKKK